MSREKIALYGGAFNPVHNGHVHLVKTYMDSKKFDKVLIIPSKNSPHKSNKEMISNEHRFHMCVLAFEHMPKIQVSDIEFNMPGKSYTINTLKKLRQEFRCAQFTFIMGSDMLFSFEEWSGYEKILEMTKLLVGARNADESAEMRKKAQQLMQKGGTIEIMDVQPLPLSSTEIRNRIREHKSIHGLVPEPVEQYIKEAKLYAE